jgi:hypothetical protein
VVDVSRHGDLIWVGFFALFRGFSDILLAFEVRGLERR